MKARAKWRIHLLMRSSPACCPSLSLGLLDLISAGFERLGSVYVDHENHWSVQQRYVLRTRSLVNSARSSLYEPERYHGTSRQLSIAQRLLRFDDRGHIDIARLVCRPS